MVVFLCLFLNKNYKKSIKTLDLCRTIVYNIITVRDYLLNMSKRRENMEQEMTNKIFETLMKAIIQILKDDGVKEETIKKIEDLIA